MPRISTYRLWLEYQSRQRTYERKAVPVFNRALKSQYKSAIDYIDQYGYETLEIVLTAVITTDVIKEAMRDVYRMTYVSSAGQELLRLRRDEPEFITKASIWETFRDLWRSLSDEYVQMNLGRRITEITETTRRKIIEVIQRERNAGSRDIGKAIRDELNDPAITRKRAVLISRTETTTAANEGHRQGAKTWANEVGVSLYKVWIATRDSRTRDAHKDMIDSQPILETQDHVVGGENMDKPGDPRGGARNVCNCRCREFYMSERKAIRDFGLVI